MNIMNRKTMGGVIALAWACAVGAQQPAIVGAAQTRLVVYRPANGGLKDAAEVRVQGRYHTTLADGVYSDMCVVAGETRLSVQQLSSNAQSKALSLTLPGGRPQYVRVSAQDGQAVLAPVDEALAQQELKGLWPQVPLVPSDVGMACGPDPEPLMQSVLRETLSADAAWLADGVRLSEAGMQTLDHWAARVRREFVQINRLRVVAHVSDASQTPVAQQRAEAVRQQLNKVRMGSDWPVVVEVLPLTASILAACSGVSPAQMATACPLAPRLLVLELVGVRR